MKRWRNALAFVGLLSFAGTAVALLHRWGSAPWSRVDWRHLPTWIRISPLEDVIAASLRLLALGLAFWLLASALLYAVARASRIPGAVAAASWVTLPAVRRAVDRAVAVVVVASAGIAPAARAAAGPSPTPPPITVEVGGDGILSPPSAGIPGSEPSPTDEGSTKKGAPSPAGGSTPGSTLPSGIDSPPSLESDADPGREPHSKDEHDVGAASSSEPQSSVDAEREHVVVSGDNLWDISAARLALARGIAESELGDSEIHPYWLKLIAANRDSLRSGEPNLIYPGEVIRLPSLPDEES